MSKPLPILDHMPWTVKREIVALTDDLTKLSLRQCSKSFKAVVDKSKMSQFLLFLEWNCDMDFVKVTQAIYLTGDVKQWKGVKESDNMSKVKFHAHPEGYLMSNETEKWDKFVDNENFIDGAVKHFVKKLRNPNVRIHEMFIRFQNRHRDVERYRRHRPLLLKSLKKHLSGLGHQVTVEKLKIEAHHTAEETLHVLPYLKPGALEYLQLTPQPSAKAASDYFKIDLTPLMELEQWKQTPDLCLVFYFMTNSPEATKHFTFISYYMLMFTLEDMLDVCEMLLNKKTHATRFIRCTKCDYPAIIEYLSQFEVVEREKNIVRYIIRSGDRLCVIGVSEAYKLMKFTNRISK